MKKYTLTEEHKAHFPILVNKWTKIAFSTGRMSDAEKEEVRDCIEDMYRLANLNPPPRHRIVIAPGAMSARFAAGFAAGIWHLRGKKSKDVDAATHAATDAATRAATDAATDAATGNPNSENSYFRYYGDLARVAEAFGNKKFLMGCAQSAYRFHQYGNMWAGIGAYYEFFRDVAKLEIDWSKIKSYVRLAEISGYRFMHKDFCIVTEKPIRLTLDDQGFAHNENGPYIEWADGSAIYKWHGQNTPRWIIEHPDRITIQKIKAEPNAEIRRIMRERYGEGKYLLETKAKILDSDFEGARKGAAPRCLLQDEDGQKFLVGTDGSTARVYYMLAPEESKTCKEAHMALCGFDESRILNKS